MSSKTTPSKEQGKSTENQRCKAIHKALTIEIYSTHKLRIAQRVSSRFNLTQSGECVNIVWAFLMRIPIVKRKRKGSWKSYSDLTWCRWDSNELIGIQHTIKEKAAADNLTKLYAKHILVYEQVDSTSRAYALSRSFIFWCVQIARYVALSKAIKKGKVSFMLAAPGWAVTSCVPLCLETYRQGVRLTPQMLAAPNSNHTAKPDMLAAPNGIHPNQIDASQNVVAAPNSNHSSQSDDKSTMVAAPNSNHSSQNDPSQNVLAAPNGECLRHLTAPELLRGVNHQLKIGGGGNSRERVEPTKPEEPTTTAAPLRYYLGQAFDRDTVIYPRLDDPSPSHTPIGESHEWYRNMVANNAQQRRRDASVVRMDVELSAQNPVVEAPAPRKTTLEWADLDPEGRKHSTRLLGLLIEREERRSLPSALSEKIVQLTYQIAMYGDCGAAEEFCARACREGEELNFNALIYNRKLSFGWEEVLQKLAEKFGDKKNGH